MPTRRSLLTGALAIGGTLARPAIRTARATAGSKLVIATQPGLGYAPLIVVKQQRWLEEAVPGLQVDWRVISSSIAIREAMLAGEVQVGCGSVAPFLVGRDRGFRTRLVSALNTVDLWLLTNDARIRSVRDLKPTDKVAVVGADTNQAFLVRKAAQQAFGDARALDPAMLSMPHPDALQALLTGQVAAYAGAPPFQEAAVARGARRLASSRDLFGPLTFNVCFARDQLATQAAPALKALKRRSPAPSPCSPRNRARPRCCSRARAVSPRRSLKRNSPSPKQCSPRRPSASRRSAPSCSKPSSSAPPPADWMICCSACR